MSLLISHVSCVCTANNLETIPVPSINHMEFWEVFGCVFEEKAVIKQHYMGSLQGEASRLKGADVERGT